MRVEHFLLGLLRPRDLGQDLGAGVPSGVEEVAGYERYEPLRPFPVKLNKPVCWKRCRGTLEIRRIYQQLKPDAVHDVSPNFGAAFSKQKVSLMPMLREYPASEPGMDMN